MERAKSSRLILPPFEPTVPHLLRLLPIVTLLPSLAAAQGMHDTRDIPTTTTLGAESVRMPAGERLGLVGMSMLFSVGDSVRIGPAVYGAASGRRGGFFVGGVEAQYRVSLGEKLSLVTGLYAGGGGGGAAPVGGGLMLRPAVTLFRDLGPTMQAGLSWSEVKFPSGQIESRQFGLVLAWRDRFTHYAASEEGRIARADRPSGLGFDRIALTASAYRPTDGSTTIGLAGARAERSTRIPGLSLALEAAGAASGQATGYMEILGGAGWSTAPVAAVPELRVGLRGAFGMGGGGAVPTGGGMIAKAAATLEFSPAPGWSTGIEGGAVRALNGSFRARAVQAWVGLDLEPSRLGQGNASGPIVRNEWTGVIQHHSRVERNDGTARPLDTIGLKLSRYITPNLYLTGQAHSAFSGGAGAYSIGLVGAGASTAPGTGRRFGAELLVGAAGGGGVSTVGGALSQAILWAGWQTASAGEWRIGAGAARALHSGGMNSPTFEVSWTKAFGLVGR